MSSIFSPEQAKSELKLKFPAVFAKAVTRFGEITTQEELVNNFSASLKKSEPSMANLEQRIWALWGDFNKYRKI